MLTANVTNQDQELSWHQVNWRKANAMVSNLRQRIYRATQENDIKRVRSLQKLVLRSKSNKLLAIRRVTQSNKGKHTAGVDGKVITTAQGREGLYKALTTKPWEKPSPSRRVYIPKSNGNQRPLGIPTILDRCKQAIVKTGLEPYWEAKFEGISYGFRPGRSAQDAMQKVYSLAKPRNIRQWVLDADIQSAFDYAC